MIDERIKSYLKDRLKKLEDLKNERRWVTSELDGEERWWTTAELGDMVCCKQTLEFIDSLQEDQSTIELAEDHAMFAGMEKMKEEMIKNAIEGLVVCDELTHGYKDIAMHIPDYLNVGDKVKLIIIKED